MKSKGRKLLSALTVIAMTVLMCTSVMAENLPDMTNDNSRTENNSAVLNYNTDNNTYELRDSKGNDLTDEFAEYEEITETTLATNNAPAVTTAPKSTNTTQTSIVKTTTTVTTVSKRWYTAAYRVDVISRISSQNAAASKKTTVKTTAKTTTTATKKRYNGIDVSRYQGDINWTKVKAAGIDFVMIRAGYGKYNDQVDSKFKENIAGAQKAGIECGVYWYSYALNTADALLEAKACYNTIKGYKLSYPVAFDIEDSSQAKLTKTQISNITKVFCDYLENLKYYVVIYSFSSFLNDNMNDSVTSKYDIWVAHINTDKPSYKGSYGMWQYSHTGKVNGISTAVDLDYSYMNYPQIIKKNKLNGYT